MLQQRDVFIQNAPQIKILFSFIGLISVSYHKIEQNKNL